MFPYPQLHVRMDTVGEPYTTITLLINEDSLDTLERQLDVLDGLIETCTVIRRSSATQTNRE